VRIIAISTLRNFWETNGDAEEPLKAWFQEVKSADWATPHQVKAMYRNASVIEDNRIVFDIAGNTYHIELGMFDWSGRTLNMIELMRRKCDGYSSY